MSQNRFRPVGKLKTKVRPRLGEEATARWVRLDEVPVALRKAAGWYEIRYGDRLLKVGISGNLLRRIRQHRDSKQSRLLGPKETQWTRPEKVRSTGSVLAKHLYFDRQIAPHFDLETEAGRVAFLKECEIRWAITKTRAAARLEEAKLERSGRYRYTGKVLVRPREGLPHTLMTIGVSKTGSGRKYAMPEFLAKSVSPQAYERWLSRKAAAHVKRDRGRSQLGVSRASYKAAIHAAVVRSQGRDAYTGEELNWKLISTYKNEESKAGRHGYKAGFALLPTVDHELAGATSASFRICSWRTNDAKHDLSMASFLDLCERVLVHAGYSIDRSPSNTPEGAAEKSL